jgi:hypothetical protein
LSDDFAGVSDMSLEKDDLADALARMSGDASSPSAVPRPEEDEVLSTPPPNPRVFAPKRSTRALVEDRALEARRTVIPILLTCGVLLPVVGSLKWLAGDESPFGAWSVWVPIVLGVLGLAILALAVLNMLQVREMLLRRRHAV